MSYRHIAEVLETEGILLEMTAGYSMSPMLKNRQNPIVIEKLTESPKRHDVVLYIDDMGRYVLHRIVKVTENGFTIRGDNCSVTEYGITANQIIGILRGYYIGDDYIDCRSNKKYMRYVSTLKFRYIYCIVRDFAKNTVKTVIKKRTKPL